MRPFTEVSDTRYKCVWIDFFGMVAVGFPRSARDLNQLSGRPVHLPSAQQMQMQMENCLARVRAHVVNGAKTVLQLAFAGDFCRHQLAIANNFSIVFHRLINSDNMLLGNDQYMRRRLRFDVFKDESLLIFVNFLGRNFSRDDLAEQAVSHSS